MPGNIPKKLNRLDLYRENTFAATFVFPAAYPSRTPTAKVERNDRVLTGVTPTFSAWSDATIQGQPKRIFSFTYTPEILDKMQGLCVQTFMLDGQAFVGGQVNSREGYGDADPVSYTVTLDGDEYIIIEVPGVDIVAGYTAEALEAAELTAADSVKTGLDRVATGQDRVQTGSDRIATGLDVTSANNAKIAAEATLPVTVATYADAVPLFTGSLFKRIDVLADADYNGGEPSHYEYKPAMPNGKKVWFMGLDPDYLTND